MDTLDLILRKINTTLNTWMISFAENIPNILVAVLIIVIFYYFAKFLAKWVTKILNKSHIHISLRLLIDSLVRILLVTFGVFFALGVVGLDKTVVSLMVGVGVIGLALGFAFKDLASNLISGLFIAIQNPFDVGDSITIKDISGSVETIRLRDTILLSDSGQRIYIPNKSFMEEPLFNSSQMTAKRIDLKISVAYDDDLEAIIEKLNFELANTPNLKKDHKPKVVVKEFGTNSVLLEIRFWIDVPGIDSIDFANLMSVKIKSILKNNGFHIPNPYIMPSSKDSAR